MENILKRRICNYRNAMLYMHATSNSSRLRLLWLQTQNDGRGCPPRCRTVSGLCYPCLNCLSTSWYSGRYSRGWTYPHGLLCDSTCDLYLDRFCHAWRCCTHGSARGLRSIGRINVAIVVTSIAAVVTACRVGIKINVSRCPNRRHYLCLFALATTTCLGSGVETGVTKRSVAHC